MDNVQNLAEFHRRRAILNAQAFVLIVQISVNQSKTASAETSRDFLNINHILFSDIAYHILRILICHNIKG